MDIPTRLRYTTKHTDCQTPTQPQLNATLVEVRHNRQFEPAWKDFMIYDESWVGAGL